MYQSPPPAGTRVADTNIDTNTGTNTENTGVAKKETKNRRHKLGVVCSRSRPLWRPELRRPNWCSPCITQRREEGWGQSRGLQRGAGRKGEHQEEDWICLEVNVKPVSETPLLLCSISDTSCNVHCIGWLTRVCVYTNIFALALLKFVFVFALHWLAESGHKKRSGGKTSSCFGSRCGSCFVTLA